MKIRLYRGKAKSGMKVKVTSEGGKLKQKTNKGERKR